MDFAIIFLGAIAVAFGFIRSLVLLVDSKAWWEYVLSLLMEFLSVGSLYVIALLGLGVVSVAIVGAFALMCSLLVVVTFVMYGFRGGRAVLWHVSLHFPLYCMYLLWWMQL